MKSFKEFLTEKYDTWEYTKSGKFESNKNNIYKAQDILTNADPELVRDAIKSLDKDGKLPDGKEFEDFGKALFVMKHASDVKNLAALKDNKLSSKQADFKKIMDNFENAASKLEGIDKKPEAIIDTATEQSLEKIKTEKSKLSGEEEQETTKEEPKKETPKEEQEQETETPEEEPKQETEKPKEEPKQETEKPKNDRKVNTDNSKEIESEIENTISDIESSLNQYAEKGDRGRTSALKKLLKNFQNKTAKQLQVITKNENKLSDPKLASRFRIDAERDIKLAKNEIKMEQRLAKAEIAKSGTRNLGDMISKRASMAKEGIKNAKDNFEKSRLGNVVRNVSSSAAKNMKTAVDKAGQVVDKVKNSKTADAIGRKTKEVVGKIDQKAADVASRGLKSRTAVNARRNVRDLGRKVGKGIGSAYGSVKNKINNLRSKKGNEAQANSTSKKVMDKATKDEILGKKKKKESKLKQAAM